MHETTGAVLASYRDPLHLHDAVAHLVAAGVTVQSVDNPGARFPALHDSPIRHGWFLPDEMVVDAKALTRFFLAAAAHQGAQIRLGVRVLSISCDRTKIHGLTTDAGVISAEHIVLAGGAWCSALAKTVGIDRPLTPLRRHLVKIHSKPPVGPWVWIDDVGVYVRPQGDHWLACACDESISAPPAGSGSILELTKAARALITAKIRAFFPALGAAQITSGWSGLRTFAPDRKPIMGSDPDLGGLWWAAGLGGSGVSGSVGVGLALATWIRGQKVSWLDPTSVSPGRPMLRRWPIYPNGDLNSARLVT
jgi:D-arginine dehydrogenase